MLDNKFCSCRYVTGPPNYELKTIFLDVAQPEAHGADGLLEAVLFALREVNCDKLFGITTDGESANTGKNRGLWRLLVERLDRDLLTMWCVAHRSDLAMEAIVVAIPELKIWLINLKSVCTYFRVSAKRKKWLQSVMPDMKEFPAYFEVRFAEHHYNVIRAVLHNLPGCRETWQSMMNSQTVNRNEKAEAAGFLRTWCETSIQTWLTALMGDITCIYAGLQKKCQHGSLIIPDVLTCRDQAVRKLRLMETVPFPGGQESKVPTSEGESQSEEHRHNSNLFVITNRRSRDAVRTECIQSAINFLNKRLSLEQDVIVKAMTGIIRATSVQELLDEAKPLIETLFPERMAEFAEAVCESWEDINEVRHLPPGTDAGCAISTRLRQMLPRTTGLLQTVLAAVLAITPHSMQTERCVSNYNNFRSAHRLRMQPETVNCHLQVALNAVGTASFDPRPAVAEFLKEDRRYREPDPDSYRKRPFMIKFFREDGCL